MDYLRIKTITESDFDTVIEAVGGKRIGGELIAHCLQLRMAEGLSLTEIPLSQRASEMPTRFRLTVVPGGMPVWRIRYHISTFEES